MAIFAYCKKCFSTSKRDRATCPTCGESFGRERKYRIEVKRAGQRVTRVVRNLTLARELEAVIEADLMRDEFDSKRRERRRPVPTLSALWDQTYLPHIQTAKKTWKNDEYLFERHIRARIGRRRLNEIGAADLEAMKAELSRTKGRNGEPLAPATVRHCLVLVRRVFNVAQKWEVYSGPNPVSFVDMPHVDNRRTEFLTPEQTARLWKTLEEWPAPETSSLVKFAMLTGFRRGEIFRLEWADVDEERAAVTLREPKGGKTAVVPVSGAAMDVLRNHRAVSGGDSPFVFPGRGGNKRTTVTKAWERLRARAGLPGLRFHALRHNFASQLVSAGTPLEVIRELLTHKDSRTTERYAHMADGPVRNAAEQSGELIRTGTVPQREPEPEKPERKVIPFPKRRNGTEDE